MCLPYDRKLAQQEVEVEVYDLEELNRAALEELENGETMLQDDGNGQPGAATSAGQKDGSVEGEAA